MLACVDVHYSVHASAAACVVFDDWDDSRPRSEHIHVGPASADYEPGEFYRRELPGIMAVLEELESKPSTIVVDGYVWLGASKKGLGAHVHDATGASVIGVAKRRFLGATPIEVFRGASKRPLYITSVGIPAMTAAAHIEAMHGPFRIPTLLKRVDRLCRDALGSR